MEDGMKNARMGNKELKLNLEKNQSATAQSETSTSDRTVEVLYQKMGERWFAFSLIDDEVFFGSLHPSEVSEAEVPQAKSKKLAGQS
jgi:hypothetical protein